VTFLKGRERLRIRKRRSFKKKRRLLKLGPDEPSDEKTSLKSEQLVSRKTQSRGKTRNLSQERKEGDLEGRRKISRQLFVERCE